MPQLHFYVPNELAHKIRLEAQAANMSVSRYIAAVMAREVSPGWPENYFETVVGGWQGEPLQRPEQGSYEERDEISPALG